MKEIKVDKSLFDRVLGISCIENYFLYVAAYIGIDFRTMYANSYISINEIAHTFIDKKISYAFFNKISRLQNIAYELGIINLTYKSNISYISDCNCYCCIKVNRNFIKKLYERVPWRDDHYMLVCSKENEKFVLLNDIPRDVVEVRVEQLHQVYDGNIVCFKFLMKNISDDIKDKLLNQFLTSLLHPNLSCGFEFDNLEIVRDIIGIIRITRKRIREYSSIYINTDFMADYIAKIDKTYAMIEYLRLRNRFDYNEVKQSFAEIRENDLRMIGKLNREIRLRA